MHIEPQSPIVPRRAYSVADAVRATSIGRSRIYSAIADGELRAKKYGRRTIILADDLDAWLARLPAANDV